MLLSANSLADTFENIFSTQIGGEKLTMTAAFVNIGSALVLGFIVAMLYYFSQKMIGGNTSLSVTLIMVPAIIALIVVLIQNNLARAFTLAGSLAIIRYRSQPASPRDIAYVLFSLAIGIACGIGYVAYAAVFTVLFCIILFIISITGFGGLGRDTMLLKILIPENLNFDGVYTDILNEYTDSWKLRRIQTTDFGTVFELIYVVKLKKGVDRKVFMDKIRCKNGNLNVTLNLLPDEESTRK
ncbi:MAG: DUF4956 domain-containing protein [Clostridia bacterium]|nr:DUF4956 domain-containing protein [Clostridia bacterium]